MQRYRAELLQRASTLQLERAHIETVFAGVNELYEAHARMLEQFRVALLPSQAYAATATADASASAAPTTSTTQPPAGGGASAAVAGASPASSNTGANSTVSQSNSSASASNGTSADEVIDSATLGDIFYANVCGAFESRVLLRLCSAHNYCLQAAAAV